jgi:SAM-dependent methyltransferase
MSTNRKLARNLAAEAISRGKPLEWFETLYRQAADDESIIPWADIRVNPNLAAWLERAGPQRPAGRALVIGCGLGDDAEALQTVGFQVTAFDISEACIAWCRRRFPKSAVDYVVADLLAPLANWHRAFDLVIEAYTLQVLPRELRAAAMQQVAGFVAADGRLVVITRGRDSNEDPGQMPWPLVREEFGDFNNAGLTVINFEDYVDSEDSPVRRFRVEYRRPADRESAPTRSAAPAV